MSLVLNEEQVKAVRHVSGPLLILAGAGSGKTRVLTERIANLIANEKVAPYNILAVTFTNKAAKEMKERISQRIGEDVAKSLWIGTFHSICSRILRNEINLLGRNSNFVIYDSTDQSKLADECLKKLNLDTKTYQVSKILNSISKAKSKGISAEKYTETYLSHFHQKVGDVYLLYEEALNKNNALDFDDLLFYVVQIFNKFPERLVYYQNKFKYILVDEYQDTNKIQYDFIRLLGDKYRNLCVVGDVDQSIYSFRNADFTIILNFQKNYPEAKIIKLEENYRSTSNIITLANHIIENNSARFPKNLFTKNEDGEKIRIFESQDDQEEVRFVINEIYRLMQLHNFDFGDFTVLYRTNAQSRLFEEYFIRNNIPHQVLGGFRFFERKEIKDILSYMKVIFNPHDSIGLQRVINSPKRGIGKTTIEKLLNIANDFNLSFWDVLNFETFENITPSSQKAIKSFVRTMNLLIEESNTISVSGLIQSIVRDTEYIEAIEKEEEKHEKDNSRVDNIYQLVNSAKDFEENSDDVSLESYLSYISLISDVDSMNNENNNVKLMTVHTSKGLEFPVVFVVGVSEGIFPHANSTKNNEIEEERRLMYVATTRAKRMLYLTFPRRRVYFGSYQNLIPSRFIFECPQDLVSGYNINPMIFDKLMNHNSIQNEYGENYDFHYDNKVSKEKYNKQNEYQYTLKKSHKKLNPIEIQSKLEERYSDNFKNKDNISYSEGQIVKNDKFGKGKITKVLKNNKKELLIINFETQTGNKIIDPNLTKINVIS